MCPFKDTRGALELPTCMCSCPLGTPVPNTMGSGKQKGAQKQGEEGCGREVAQAQLGVCAGASGGTSCSPSSEEDRTDSPFAPEGGWRSKIPKRPGYTWLTAGGTHQTSSVHRQPPKHSWGVRKGPGESWGPLNLCPMGQAKLDGQLCSGPFAQ